jgi:hypothetical protein
MSSAKEPLDDYSFLPGLLAAGWRAIRRFWWYTPVGAVAGIVFGILLLRVLPPTFEATITLTQKEQENSNLSSVSSLAAGLGIGGLGPATTNTLELYTTLLTDPSLMKFLAARQPEFMTLLFPDQWNPKTKSWHSPSGVLPAIKRGIKVMAGFPAWQKPSPVDAARIVRGLVQISDARKTDFRTITIVDTSGKRAVALLNILHNGADEMLRMRDREQSEKRVAYLRDKLKVETEISQRDSLTQLLKEEDRRLMLSHIDVPYSVKIVTPPEVFPTTPNSRLAPAIILGLLFGGAIGAAFALFHGFRPHRWPFGK